MQKVTLAIIRFYQRWISAAMPPRCRFVPSCSSYTLEAIEEHGLGRGVRLGITRICKCHPFHAGGYDPVPSSSSTKEQA